MHDIKQLKNVLLMVRGKLSGKCALSCRGKFKALKYNPALCCVHVIIIILL